MSETKKLFSNSLIVVIGTGIASVFSYLFNMLMGRLLGPENYGEMTALISVLAIVSVTGGAIITVTMRYSSELYSSKKFDALRRLFSMFSRYILIFSSALFLLSIIFSKLIANYLLIPNVIPVIIIFSSLIFGSIIQINKGILQGTQKFSALSVVGIIEMVLRLVLGLALVKIGMGLSGALLAVVLATAFSYVSSLQPIGKIFKQGSGKKEQAHRFDKKEILNYSWPSLVSAALLVLALNLDVILIKHYFPVYDAGVYAAISTVGKIILYITSPIVSVMFPMISEKTVTGDKHYKIFLFSLLFLVVAGLTILGIYVIAPGKIIGLLYGPSYLSFYYLLPEVGLAIMIYSLVNLLANYYLVVKDFKFLWFFIIDLLSMTVAIHFYHPSILAVIRLIILFFSLLFIGIMVYYLSSKRDQLKSLLRGEEI